MIQLTYQAAFDPFHTVFRFLRLRDGIFSDKPLARDHVRILDFYLLFPFRSGEIRVQQKHRRFKKVAKHYDTFRPYGDLPDDRVLLNRMTPIQGAALDTLAKKGLLDLDSYERGLVVRADGELADELTARVTATNDEQSDLIEFLAALAAEYDLLGPNGLKDRTGLMDFSYDAP